MKLAKKDYAFIVVLAVILIVLVLKNGSEKARPTPSDSTHGQLLKKLAAGQNRSDLEKECLNCHNQQTRPLSKKHPPKEQCLICHR